jgi:hypothetical protein
MKLSLASLITYPTRFPAKRKKMNRTQYFALFGLLALACGAQAAQQEGGPPPPGQEPGMRGRFGRGPGGGFDRGPRLLMSPEVQKELKLSADQIEKLRALRPPPPPPRERMGEGGPPMGPRDEKLKTILTPHQYRRLEQIRLQMEGPRALLRPDIAEKLALTHDERSEIEDLMPRGGQGRGGFGRGPRRGGPGEGGTGEGGTGEGGPRWGGPDRGGPGVGGPDRGGPGGAGPGGGGPGDFGGPEGGPPPGPPGEDGRPPMGRMRGRPPMARGARRREEERAMKILTPSQRSKWKEMLGEPFEMDLGPPPRR